jgi:hypothetical protein
LAVGTGDPSCTGPFAYGEGSSGPPTAISVSPITVPEGSATDPFAVFQVRLSAASPRDVTVDFDIGVTSDTATAGTDFLARTGTLRWTAEAEIVKQLAFLVVDDTQAEGSETFTLKLSDPANATLNVSSAVATITEGGGGGGLTISVADASVTEADGTTGVNCVFRTTLSASPASSVSVTFATTSSGGGTATPGSDYTSKTNVLTWPANATTLTKSSSVKVRADNVAEGPETFFLQLSDPQPATVQITRDRATCTIDDDDGPPPPPQAGLEISIADASITETDPGTTRNCSLKVTLSKTPSVNVTVKFATSSAEGGTATPGSDYTAKSGKVTWAAESTQLTKSVNVKVIGDSESEPSESFFVDLSNPQPTTVTITRSKGTCTILDDAGG